MSLRGTLQEDVNWIQLIPDRVQRCTFVNMGLNSQVPLKAGNYSIDSKKTLLI
jgi:hypothetical protein